MSYRVVLDKKADDFFLKLPEKIKKRIVDKLILVESNPFHFFERLEGRKEYKLRVGDYRAIADINDNLIEVRFIGHRKNIYKKS